MSDFTPEQVERAAEVLWFGPGRSTFYGLDELSESSKRTYRAFAEEILSAAGAPEKPVPVVDEEALERLIMGRTATAAAREVAAYLRGESK